MIRFLFIFCALLLWVNLSGQVATIKKSQEIVVIKGNSYYLHTVKDGQTLFSICNAYDVDIEQIRKINSKKDNTLSLDDVLKIPYTEPYVQRDSKYYYHKMEKGESLYSVARRFGIKVKQLLTHNPSYNERSNFLVGTELRLPLNEINKAALPKEKMKTDEQLRVEVKTSKSAATVVPVKTVVKIESYPMALKEEKSTEKPILFTTTVLNREASKVTMPEYITEVVMPGDPYVKVAVLLPLYAKEYRMYGDTLNSPLSISSKSEQFLGFYEGILLAVDSLKNKGHKIELHVFDTERSPDKMRTLTSELNELNPDLIIGPVYGSVFKVMADNLHNKDIPMVYPLSSRNEGLGKYANFVQVNTSFNTMARGMEAWIEQQSAHANMITIDLSRNKWSDDQGDLADRKEFINKMHQVKDMDFFKWDAYATPLVALKSHLQSDKENIIILPLINEAEVSKILPSLAVYADNYKITVVGLPEWQTFASIDHETYYKLNVKLFMYSYVDIYTAQAKSFAEQYRKYFYAEPNNLANKAFDLGLYFIELASKYRDRMLEALPYYRRDEQFSTFKFEKIQNGEGLENRGLYIVNYGADYQIKVERLNL